MNHATGEHAINGCREEVLREYYSMQHTIDGYNEQTLKIKSWSVTLSALAIGLGIKEGLPALFILASASSLIFWIVETLWKYPQHIAIQHQRDLERLLNGDLSLYRGPTINKKYKTMFEDKPHARKAKLNIFWYQNVILPHIIVICLGLALWFATHYHWLSFSDLKA